MVTISVIGVAGRGDIKLSIQHFQFMCNKFIEFIKEHKFNFNEIQLVSGGAAFSDHVAVDTFLKYPDQLKLKLYLPCEICISNKGCWEYKDTGLNDWRKNPGKLSNTCHKSFSNIVKRNTIDEIIKARDLGATLDTTSNGFHSRNTKVSKSDYIVAFTFSSGNAPETGGTLDTWKKSKSNNKYHFTIPSNFDNDNIDKDNNINKDEDNSIEEIVFNKDKDNRIIDNAKNNVNHTKDNKDKDNNKANNITNYFNQKSTIITLETPPTLETTSSILSKRTLSTFIEEQESTENKKSKKEIKISDYFVKNNNNK